MKLALDGGDGFQTALAAAAADLGDFTDVNQAIAVQLRADAVPRTPVRTGRLVQSLQPFSDALTAGVRTAVPYANPVHSGVPSKGIRPRPFLTAALGAQADAIADAYATKVGKIIDRVGD